MNEIILEKSKQIQELLKENYHSYETVVINNEEIKVIETVKTKPDKIDRIIYHLVQNLQESL